jgi:hypothetical protein
MPSVVKSEVAIPISQNVSFVLLTSKMNDTSKVIASLSANPAIESTWETCLAMSSLVDWSDGHSLAMHHLLE